MNRARRSPTTVLLLPILAAALAAGCGGGADSGEYEAGLARVQGHLSEATEASQGAAGVSDPEERGAALKDAHASIEDAATEAAELDAPDDVDTAHDQLVEALQDYADLYERLANTPEDDPSLTELYGEAGVIVERLDAANRAIDEAGYEVAEASSADE